MSPKNSVAKKMTTLSPKKKYLICLQKSQLCLQKNKMEHASKKGMGPPHTCESIQVTHHINIYKQENIHTNF